MQEAQDITSLPASTLRYWEQQFPMLNPRKDKHGNRYYTEEHLNLIKQIKFIRDELKITRIDAIRNHLLKDAKNIDRRQRALDILQRIKQQLLDIKQNL